MTGGDAHRFAERIAALTPAQRDALLARLGQVRSAPAQPDLRRRLSRAAAPLSYAQQRLWFLHQLEPASPAYNMPLALPLSGLLDVEALERALQEIVRRHETLRTSFPSVGGEPVQVVSPDPVIPLNRHDLSEWPQAERQAEARRIATSDALRPFDLAGGPVVRLTLIRLSDHRHLLAITMHHIVSDGWSLGVLNGEITALYGAFVAGRPSPLPPLEIQYSDFTEWQRTLLQGEVLERQLAYWQRQLDQVSALELPTDRGRPRRQTYAGAVEGMVVGPEVLRRLKRLSESEGVTLAITLLAAFKALMYRYTGQTDIVIGSPIANRTRRELEGLIGFFVNTLVMRTDLSGNPTFRTLLARVKETAFAAYEHQDLPFERLVQELQPERDPTRHPLFQVMFAVQNAPTTDIEMPGLQVEAAGLDVTMTRFDLECHMWDRGEILQVGFCYNTDLFDDATVRRMMGHFRLVLEGVSADPEQSVSRLPLMPPAERTERAGWETQPSPYPRDATLAGLFEQQAVGTPNAAAVAFGDTILTYAELNRRANRLAHYLRARGVGAGTLVGLSMDRSADLIVALLGIVKAGGAYVPLDPEYPQARLAHMLEETRPPVVVTQRESGSRLPAGGYRLVCLDTDGPEIAGHPDRNPAPAASADDLAYVMYTSGSTGRPKGTCIEQRSVVRLVMNTDYVSLGPEETFLQLAPMAFDAATFEVWGSLLHGAKLVVAPPHRLSLEDLGALIERERVSVLWLTAAVFHQMVDRQLNRLRGVRQLLAGGEALSVPHVQRMLATLTDDRRLINGYGPTENTTFTCCHVMTRNSVIGSSVPIGRPIANTQVYVVDAAGQDLPAGVPGELLIGGDGLAREYWGQPDLTADRFVHDPVRGRLYRTGDRVRYLADGTIEFLGRRDQQVKLRGYRIELGETEAVLAEHADVREVAVLAREDEPGDKRLVAYVVPDWDRAEQGSAREAQHVGDWQALYEQTYGRDAASTADPTFDITGWNSSYTGAPIPPEEMREWVVATVDRIRGLGPRRVLEIGCGTGLLLHQLAPECAEYVGTDFSEVVLGRLGRSIAERAPLAHVALRHQTADDFSGLAPRGFDLVVINSVTQYLPTVAYLERVVAGAIDAVAPGGHVFVGDVRSLPLLEAYHASVQAARSSDALPVADWTQRVREHVAQEEELVIDPAFFETLRARLPRLTHVDVLVKRGRHRNELTRFRYDVVLHVDGEPAAPAPEWLDWEGDRLAIETLRERLASSPARLGLRNVPNARVAAESLLLEWLREPPGGGTVAALRKAAALASGVEPELLWELGAELGFGTAVSYAASGDLGRLDVVFERCAGPPGRPVLPARAIPAAGLSPHCTTTPLKGKIIGDLVPALRSHAELRLPEYMVPSAFVILEAMPLNRNGKIDRRALPAPAGRRQLGTSYVAARSPVEQQLVAIWSEVLRIEQIGIHDNFFELGGHSLLATQVISRIRDALQADLPLRALFEAPTVAGLTEVLALGGGGMPQAPPLLPATRNPPPPLSFAQQRLWFLQQLDPTSSAYNVPVASRIVGPLDVGALERSCIELIRRHESLRTTFEMVGREPIQRIADPPGRVLSRVDLRGLPEVERTAEVQRLAAKEERTTFDLALGPLVRVTLVQLGEQEHVLLLTLHHIVCDGWSLGLVFSELTTLYRACKEGEPSPLPPLPVQPADFAVWQRGWLTGPALAAQLSYWSRQLADLTPLTLPTDRPRPTVETFRGADYSVMLPERLVGGIRELCNRHGTTLFMTMLTAFKVVLHRYTGQADIVIGTPIANRTRQELEGLIGFFVNTLVLRTVFTDAPTFRELLARVRDTALAAYAHQDLPFELLVEAMQPERDLGKNPLFDVLFAVQNARLEPPELAGASMRPLGSPTTTTHFDLQLHVWEQEDGLRLSFNYSTDLFDASTIARLAGHLQRVLEGAVDSVDQPIATMPLLTRMELDERVRWNQTDAVYRSDATLHGLFEEQAARTPEATAVIWRGQPTTYRDLSALTDRLAHRLIGLGVSPDDRVGICVERSLDLAVGILGILKAGGAYVPLDVAYPPERLRYMLGDSGASVVVTQTTLLPLIDRLTGDPGTGGAPGAGDAISRPTMVCLDREDGAPAGRSEGPPPSRASARHLAYVMYTSGSTGRPKGVALEHRPLVNLVEWELRRTPLGVGARTLQFTPLSFDPSLCELFVTWCSGGTLVLLDEETRLDFGELARFVHSQGIHRLFMPFVALQQLAERCLALRIVPSELREIVTAGEQPQTTAQIEAFFSGLPDCRLWNDYGPTETHVVTSYALVGPPSSWPVLPPIGTPIPNTRVYLLDIGRQPVPVGIPGELFAAGDCLARGYLNRPELTDERFIPDPFDGSGARMYRTGDLARYRPDGVIEYLGRADSQVKIRGFRVELGEVEVVLTQCPGVLEAVVLAREDVPGDKRLVAYVVLRAVDPPGSEQIRAFLAHTLPGYMVPAVVVVLSALPLTPSGKIDRRSLPAPSGARPSVAYVDPRNATEAAIAAIWRDLLRIDRVGVHDNFFELGGHSLLATQLVSRLRDECHARLPLRAVFEEPTVEGLARRVADPAPSEAPRQTVSDLKRRIKDLSPSEREALLAEARRQGGAP